MRKRGEDNLADEEASSYQERVIQGALEAVVAAGSIDGDQAGHVDIDVAINGLCDAIATLEAAAKISKSLSDRRKWADLCRQRIIATGSGLARMVEAGEPLGWHLEALARPN